MRAVKASLIEFRSWLDGNEARVTPLNLVNEKNNQLQAGEAIISLKIKDRSISLPLAFVIGKNKNEQINEIRFYHSYWPIEEQHHVRLNTLPLEVQAPKIPPDVLAYHAALRDGNIENVLGLFSKGGSIREPSGGISGPGQESKLQDFSYFLKKGCVFNLPHTIVDNEKYCAAEYTCTKWGTTEIIPQAGMEFFDREEQENNNNSLFKSVRIYDDINQPEI